MITDKAGYPRPLGIVGIVVEYGVMREYEVLKLDYKLKGQVEIEVEDNDVMVISRETLEFWLALMNEEQIG